MLIPWVQRRTLTAIVLSALATLCLAQEETQLTPEQQREFLLNAEVIGQRQTSTGSTSPYRLTLSDGKITHDALFQSVDERRPFKQFSSGRSEINFVDSYLYNLAAYELARLLGMDDMLPVTVLRKWKGKPGSLSWWLPVQMDEAERTQKKIQPPDIEIWNQSMYKSRVFTELIYDTDRNLGNVLVGKDWKLYIVDFTRAFRLYHALKNPDNLVRCSRTLLERLRALDSQELASKTKGYLKRPELEAVMKRRDLIVAYFEKLIAEKGQNAILY
jgi:hypothetical protein